MREPETPPAYAPSPPAPPSRTPRQALALSVSVVGRGRVGTALASALSGAGTTVEGPLGRNEPLRSEVVLLCVPDAAIASSAEAVAATATPTYVGHVSGATPLSALDAARRMGAEVFGLHPLQAFPQHDEPPSPAGAACAVAASGPAALEVARALAERLGMTAFEIDDERRAAYHAAASIASNFLVTLEAAAEAVAADAGFSPGEARALLAPLVRQTVENWAAHGPEAALTGPVARGDAATVAAQRAAVASAQPALLELYDALVGRTEALAARVGRERPVEVAA